MQNLTIQALDCASQICGGEFQIMSERFTSIATQGGGGSVENWEPIGEVGCGNHGWQSELTDGSKGGWSVGPSSVYLFFCLALYPSIYICLPLSIRPSVLKTSFDNHMEDHGSRMKRMRLFIRNRY